MPQDYIGNFDGPTEAKNAAKDAVRKAHPNRFIRMVDTLGGFVAYDSVTNQLVATVEMAELTTPTATSR